MRILIDGDSIVYSSCFSEDNAESAKDKFWDTVSKITSEITDVVGFCEVDIFHGNVGGNFREDIQPSYKANRTAKKPDHFKEVSESVMEFSVQSEGSEVDDIIAFEAMKDLDNTVIATIDKDFFQIPTNIYIWRGKKKGMYRVNKDYASMFFWTQMITGDAADNVNYLKGLGPKTAKRLLAHTKTPFERMLIVARLFVDKFGSEWRDKFIECRTLLEIGNYTKDNG